MNLITAIHVGLHLSTGYPLALVEQAYEVLCNTDRWDDHGVLAAKGNIEGYLGRVFA
jgi:hypothetical protein